MFSFLFEFNFVRSSFKKKKKIEKKKKLSIQYSTETIDEKVALVEKFGFQNMANKK